MSTVQSVIDSLRFDLIDDQNTNIENDTDVLAYLQRALDFIYNMLVRSRANIGLSVDTTTYSVDTTTTVANPLSVTNLFGVHSIYRQDVSKPLTEATWGEIIYLNSTVGPPTRWLMSDSSVYFGPQPDATYNLTILYYPTVTLELAGDMPFSGKLDNFIREAAKMLFQLRGEHDLSAYAAIRGQFLRNVMMYIEGGHPARVTDLAWGFDERL